MAPQTPEDVHTERVVLGAMLVEPNAANDALEFLVAEDFFLDAHQRIYNAVLEVLANKLELDLITVSNQLRKTNELESVGGRAYLAECSEGLPRRINIVSYVRIVKDKSVLRRLVNVCEASAARAMQSSEETNEIIEDVEEQILELAQMSTSRGFTTMSDTLRAAGGADWYVEEVCSPVEITGIPMGFLDLDSMTGGMRGGELIIIAARPSMGKTALAVNIATNVKEKDSAAVVALFSIEMSTTSVERRLISSMGRVDGNLMQRGFISSEDRNKIAGAVHWLDRHSIHIDDTPSITPTQMRAKARRLKQKENRLDLIVVDYLQLMAGGKKFENRTQEVSYISRSLKALSKELDVPVVALAQLSRSSERHGDKRPMLSDLRESGQIEQDADVVMFIHREEYYRGDDDPDVERGTAEIILAKQRNGPTGTRKLAYIAKFTRFDNLHIER